MAESQAPPSGPVKRPRHGQEPPLVPEDVVAEQILTRVPPAAAVRFRAACRAWRAAPTSDHFVRAHRAARADGQPPEIVFFAPAAAGPTTTAFYTCKLTLTNQQNGSSSHEASASARELVTVENLCAGDVVLSGTKPCHGLTLLFELGASAYHVCNLSTGDHVALPPCARARGGDFPYPYDPFVFSSTGLGFDPAAGEHKVVRLYDDGDKNQQRCEVYGLRSGGWRPCAGQAPPHAAKGLDGLPPVFLDGCFYWHIDFRGSFTRREAMLSTTPEPILSLSVDTEQFGWVRPPEERAQSVFSLAELDGALCFVVDARRTSQEYELWTRTAAGGSPGSSWSLRCRVSLASVPSPVRDEMGRGIRMLPLGSVPGRKTTILLATSCHVVFAYDPENC